jgi:hypothetical protein
MLNQAEMRRLVDMQHRSYLLLRWMAKAVLEGFVSFETAHVYSTLPEAAEGWILGHYLNVPDNARPAREDLPAFCAFFATYLENSFDLISNPGKQLYSPDAHCFCPMCSWLVDAPHLKTKKLTPTDKHRAQTMRINAIMNLAAQHRLDVGEGRIQELLNDRQVFEDASLVAYGYDLLRRANGIATGPAVLALWRGFAWNASGRPSQVFDSKRMGSSLQRTDFWRCCETAAKMQSRRTWPNNAMNSSGNRPTCSLRSATSTLAAYRKR